MPKDLTDVDAFTSPIRVPVGIDSRNNAAGDVELVAQRLANRTHHLNQHAAKRDAANTFTQPQTMPALVVTDDASVGDLLTTGRLKVTGAGVGAIVDHDLSVGGECFVTGDSHVEGSLAVAGHIRATGAGGYIHADDDVRSSARFEYSPVVTRRTVVPLSSGYGTGTAIKALGGEITLGGVAGPDQFVTFPIRLPQGAVLQSVDLMCKPLAATSNTIYLYMRHLADWAANPPVPPTPALLGTVSGPVAAGTARVLTVTIAGGQPVNSAFSPEEYDVTYAGAAGDKIYAVQLHWTDPGPRND